MIGDRIMVIKNGKVLSDRFEFINADIAIEDGIIATIDKDISGEEKIDAEGMLVLPGFIDSHFHGAVGEDFFQFTEKSYKEISEFEARNGTTSLVPTFSSTPLDETIRAINYYIDKRTGASGAKYIGIHLEGPFLSSEKAGAMVKDNLLCGTVDKLEMLLDAGKGEIRIITIAPEIEGAESIIKMAVKKGVTVSMGHSNATYEEAERGVLWGARRTTHTYNCMSPLNHREPNMLGCALTNKNICCELICDFFHIHPTICKMTFDIKGSDGIILITDSEMGAGLSDGEYRSAAGNRLIVKNGQTRLADGTISGGSSCLIDCIKNLVSAGVKVEDAVKAASLNPAKSIGMDYTIGSIKEGKCADIVICDEELNIKYVFVDGRMVHKA